MKIKICEICGIEFQCRDSRTRCCDSPQCKKALQHKKYAESTKECVCSICGKSYFATGKQKKDCCPDCTRGKGTYKYKEMYEQQIVCRQCGALVKVVYKHKTHNPVPILAAATCESCKLKNYEASSLRMKLKNPAYQNNVIYSEAEYLQKKENELQEKLTPEEKEIEKLKFQARTSERMRQQNPMKNPEIVAKARNTARERRKAGLYTNDGTKRKDYKGTRGIKQYLRIKLADWRIKNFERTNYTCEICGTRGGMLHVHHTTKFSTIVEEFAAKLQLDLKLVEYKSEDYLQLEQLVLDYHNTNNIGVVVCESCHDTIDEAFHKQKKNKA